MAAWAKIKREHQKGHIRAHAHTLRTIISGLVHRSPHVACEYFSAARRCRGVRSVLAGVGFLLLDGRGSAV
eukprot:721213-Amphidinium_carterae.1